MSDTDVQPAGGPAPATPGAAGSNPLLEFVQHPRIVLGLLITWSLLTVVAEAINQSSIFADLPNGDIHGALGGLALAWQGIPLAVLYADSARDLSRHRRIFWLAMVHMGAAIAANIYHLAGSDVSPESVILPLASASALFVLSFLQIFKSRRADASPAAAADAT